MLFQACDVGITTVEKSAERNSNTNVIPDAVLATRSGQGVSYIQTVNMTLTTGTVDQKNAKQIISDWPFLYSFEGAVFVSGYNVSPVTRFSVQDDGSIVKSGAMGAPAGSWLGGMAIVSSTKGYVTLYALGQVVTHHAPLS